MEIVTFICPNKTRQVHHWVEPDVENDNARYHSVTCRACGKIHLVNLKTGRVLDAELRPNHPGS